MRRTAILLGAGLLIAAPIADAGLRHIASEGAASAVRRLAFGQAGVSFRNVALDPWRGALRIDDLAAHTPWAAIRIAHLTYVPDAAASLIVASARAATGNIAADDITVDAGDAIYKIARIEMAGTDLSEDDLKALFDAKSSLPIADRLSRITAAKITIPEASVQLKNMPTNGGLVYHGIELTNVVNARAAQGTIASLDATLIPPDAGAVEVNCGQASAKDYDLAQNVRIMSETGTNAEEPKLLYGSFSVAGCKVKFDKTRAVVDIGSISLTDVKGRPPMQPWSSAKQLFESDLTDSDDAELLLKRRAYLADVYASYDVKAFDVRDLRIGSDQDGTLVAGSIGRLSLANFGASKIGEIRIADLNFDANGTKLKLASGAVRGINLAELGKLITRKTDDPPPPAPVVNQFLLESLHVDAVDRSSADAHLNFRLAKCDINSTGDSGSTRFALALDHFTAGLADLNLTNVAEIVALGYRDFDFSSRVEINFDREKQQLGIEDLSVTGKDMGVVKLSGDFSQVSNDVFSADTTVAEAAMLAALINRVEIRVENAGLFERIVAAAAKRDGKSPDEIRRSFVEAVSVGVPAMLENGPGAKLIGAALAKFVAAPKNIHIVARSSNGLGASDFAAAKQPGALMERLQIEATANE
jgi:hypothetical protein